jgi:uncharacterized protein (TIGR02646 family)
MKYISKQRQPRELIAWVRAKADDEEAKHIHWTYDDMPSDVRKAVKKHLVQEQGGLCCYTGRRIKPETSHIEHLKPQAVCVKHEDTDYGNLLAAHPASDAPSKCPYGAHEKGDWYDQLHFVNPRRQDCERRFRYRDNGHIGSMSQDDAGATQTIQHLQLDHRELQQMRTQIIHEAIFAEQLNEAQARRLLAAMDERDGDGNYRPFCFVIKQACERYLKRFEKPKGKK